MKKQVCFFLFIFTLLFAGCGAAGGNVVHQDGNLIVTNYSSREITDTTITHSGQTVAVSPDAIQDTSFVILRLSQRRTIVIRFRFWMITARSIRRHLPITSLQIAKS